MEAAHASRQNRIVSNTTQAIGDTEWLQALDLAHQVADLPESDWFRFLSEQDLDAELEKLVLELAAEFEPVPEFGVGSQLGRYLAIREIGRGATSQIFAATDQDLGRNVALKILNTERLGDEDLTSCLLREARAVSALSHPNLVTVYEVVRAGRLSALAMEYVPGLPLRSMMGGPLTLEACLPIWRQVAKALEATHAAGIAHRDMKPENIMVRPDGLVKVLDFGMTGSSQDPEWEQTSGTPRYMSPEQCRSPRTGVETDIFSLGVVFYEMITGHYAFDGESAWDTMTSIVEDAPVAPSTWNPAISRQVDALILSMLQKDPGERPSAAELLEELERLSCPATLRSAIESLMNWAAGWVSTSLRGSRQVLAAAGPRTASVIPS